MPDGNRLPEPYASLADGLGAAQAALMRGDRDGALGIWAALRAQFPDHPAPVARAIPVLAQLGREDEAQSLLAEAQEKFPSDPSLAAERARLAQIRRDFPAAIRLWEDMRARFPQNVTAYLGAAACLRDAGRLDDAEREIAAVLERFPNLPGPMMESARLAQARRDWPEAARRWESVRSLFPDHVAGYMGGAIALREAGRPDEADALLRAAVERFPADAGAAIDYARLAQTRVDWPQALRRWDDAHARFPDVAAVSVGMALALRQSGRLDEAERLAAEAMVRFPNEAGLALEYAATALRRDELPEAADRFAIVIERFPAEPRGYIGRCTALARQMLIREAEEVIKLGCERLPDDASVAVEHARLPALPDLGYERDWDESLSRLARVRNKFPWAPSVDIVQMTYLRGARRLEEADALGAQAVTRFSANLEIRIEWALVAEEKGDWEEAKRRYQGVRTDFPHRVEGLVGVAVALSHLGQFDEAERLLSEAMTRFPTSPKGFTAFASVALRKKDDGAALARWADACKRFPAQSTLPRLAFEDVMKRPNEVKQFRKRRALERIYIPRLPIWTCDQKTELHDYVADHVGRTRPVHYLEFGVFRGESILSFAKRFTHEGSRFVGFDSFRGLPEDWEGVFEKGAFDASGQIPVTNDQRVSFVKGWFQNTVPGYLRSYAAAEPDSVVIHFDADLYTSTLFLLGTLWHVFAQYYFIFDEFLDEELVALDDFSSAYPVKLDFYAQRTRRVPYQVFGRLTRAELKL